MLSLDLLHTLTSAQKMELHVKVKKGSVEELAKYGHFAVGPAAENYPLTIGEFDSTLSGAGDALGLANGAPWSTPNEFIGYSSNNCAHDERSAFWLSHCNGEAMPFSLLWPSNASLSPADRISFRIRPNP